ncbi:MAG TPA: DUF3616 domain-containing protein [Leptolyngbyaceae cyanobacterium M33_DOE_097]|nr:DUF3616 domain-containing protein [Leptolyngbyaceae cyanobacterium M33_DOE_097]
MTSMKFVVEAELKHMGTCDASGSTAIDPKHFVVANDEDNILRIYHANKSGKPIHKITGTDINSYFQNNPKQKEVDIEGATQLGETIYWITSHGTNKKGKPRPERRQFFANKISSDREDKRFQQVGYSYTHLLEDMLKDARLSHYCLETAAQTPPKEAGGLNIEGLAATPEQNILIGFRNPIHKGKAILLPFINPNDVITRNTNAIFGEPIELDLNGLGIRSIEYWSSHNQFIIVAGPHDSGDEFALYQWSGQAGVQPKEIEVIGLPTDFRPESVLFYPNSSHQFQLLSDDGSVERSNGIRCKNIQNEADPNKYFRSVWIKVENV